MYGYASLLATQPEYARAGRMGEVDAGLMLAVLAASLVFMLWRIRSMNDPPAS